MASVARRILKWVELPESQQGNRWTNEDLEPVPPEKQTWGVFQYVELWFLVNMNISSYQTGSSLLAVGMTWWQAIIVILVGDFFASCFVVLNSISGATSHLGYPIVSRSVWGMWGAYFPILNRILLSVVWYGVQAVIGGKMIYICLRSIWIDLDDRIPNTLPEKTGITTAQFMGYVLFNLLCGALIWFKPQQLRPYFHVGSVLVLVTMLSLLGWACGTSKGYGSVLHAPATISGSKLGWAMCAGIMSVIGSIAAGILNQNDYTRFAKRKSQVTWSQGIGFNVSSAITHIVGVLVTAATQEQYGKGEPLWDPSALFKSMQDQGGSRARAATFFLATVFIISQLSINVPGNVLAGGLDVASILPKYINLRRGAYILAILSVAPNPWQQLASGSTFLSVLSAYAVFLGPFIGLLCIHFYIIQKRQFHVTDLYTGNKTSLYWYHYGINWRTAVAWICAVVPSLPGFLNSVNPSIKVSIHAQHLSDLSFVVGFCLACFNAYFLHWIFPYDYDKEIFGEEIVGTSEVGVYQENIMPKAVACRDV
ncbi:permease for cytosine/purines, uracil, thiamine, allantoin-domain-containing protein [Phyllosticta citriasiana]|uniref:Permease for cytosine/purines, uracil, thiamine, allantoin-domain-containing protein n=1 Tax=Phyllosticta citriasiana TaxID=595635 RepID=A0ABR1KAT2_9PEZI